MLKEKQRKGPGGSRSVLGNAAVRLRGGEVAGGSVGQTDEDSDFYVNEFDMRTPDVNSRSLDVLTGGDSTPQKPGKPPL